MIKLSIVFLNYNRLSQTRKTAERLFRLLAGRDDMEIIAVDNASSDGTQDYLQQQADAGHLQAIRLHDNSGIGGYNEGFARAKGEYILVLDDDSCPRSIQELDYACDYLAQNGHIGIIACHIERMDGSMQWSWHLPKPEARQPGPRPSPFFIGCGFIIRRELFARCGWYPAHFFLYQNEVEVAFHCYQLGYQIYYLPKCRIEHRGEPSLRPGWRRVFYATRNSLLLIRAWYPAYIAWYMILSRMGIGLFSGVRFAQLPACFRGIREGLQMPVHKQTLPAPVYQKTRPFFRQNSILHQLLRIN